MIDYTEELFDIYSPEDIHIIVERTHALNSTSIQIRLINFHTEKNVGGNKFRQLGEKVAANMLVKLSSYGDDYLIFDKLNPDDFLEWSLSLEFKKQYTHLYSWKSSDYNEAIKKLSDLLNYQKPTLVKKFKDMYE
jgi:hypothetical protein